MKNATCLKDGYKTEWKLISIAENTTLDFILTSGNNPPDIELQYKLEKYNDKWLYIFEAICSGGTDRVDFTFDDILQETVTGPGPTYTWQFLTSELLRGHTICAIAYDGAGNNASDCIEFRTRSLNIESPEEDCIDCQSNGKTHLAEKLLNNIVSSLDIKSNDDCGCSDGDDYPLLLCAILWYQMAFATLLWWKTGWDVPMKIINAIGVMYNCPDFV
jgi:hypothetical protein